jgi:anti-sigma B factor antagonist
MALLSRFRGRLPESQRIELSVTFDETVYLIEPRGELDLATAPELEEELERAERSSADEIVVDLSGLESIDSSGIWVLIRAARRSGMSGDRLRLLRGNGQIERVMVLCGLHERLPFKD